ncbi:MAG: ABC transporter permease [Verrucomicrobia bacterium]|nr:ABC transporter permease [Verrucomicrobiota bacterium]
MSKIATVAWNEYRQVVFTKSFVIGLIFPVLLYGAFFLLFWIFGDTSDTRDRKFIVVDETGAIYQRLADVAQERNTGPQVFSDGRQRRPRFVPELYQGELTGNDVITYLSDQVRDGDIFAFVVIGRDYLPTDGGPRNFLAYYSDNPGFNALPDWLERQIQSIVEEIRLEEAGLNRRQINALLNHNSIGRFGLAAVDDSGQLIEPREELRWLVAVLPIGFVMLMFIAIQMATPVMLNSVMEEKFQRIAEVLLSSVTPFQLLTGKLLAGMGISLTFAVFYLFSLAATLKTFDQIGWLPFSLYFWFLLFLILALLTFGSMYAGISAASGDLKDAQNYAGIASIILVIPMMLSFIVAESPDGPFSVVVSMIPPFSAMTMLARIAVPPGPPDWQIWLAVFFNFIFALVTIWAASRVFRIGILSQGKSPSFKEWLRWVFRNN